MAEERRRSFSGSLPSLPARFGPLAVGSSSQTKQTDVPSTSQHFLPALGPASGGAPGPVAAACASSLASASEMVMALKQKSVERSEFAKGRSKSVPRQPSADTSRPGSGGRIRQARQQLPIRRPERVDSAEIKKSIAAKLQPLEQVTNSILASVEERKSSGPPLLKATCKDFIVGRANCPASSVLTVYPDRFEYKFSHSTQGRIDMVMYIKDMLAPELDLKTLTFKFRVGKPLRHFIDAYDCTDPGHMLALTFHEKADVTQFQEALASSCKVAVQVVH